MTDPSKYCRDTEQYEEALSFLVNELCRLLNDVGIGKVLQPSFNAAVRGLYGKESYGEIENENGQ